ncbi:MAG: tRNA lysidine(34) synthetase TilS [Chitinophagaceae bacterium]|nr:tRNA lysidine(34) synthetase TilS [Chitinophagaceae bacterium]
MNELIEKIRACNQRHKLFEPNDLILIAVSGGVDSVVLCHALASFHGRLMLLHCNFGLRGAESNRDEAFVRQLAERLGLPLHVKAFDTADYARQKKLSIQLAARELRYTFFEAMRQQYKQPAAGTWIATAHHANDLAETMLINLFRGTGLDGLRGIPAKNGAVIRPMLLATRQQVIDYAKQFQLEWVEDSSNAKNDYARNLIRNKVFSDVETHFPAVVSNMAHTAQLLAGAAEIYHQQVHKLLKKVVVMEGEAAKVPVLRILGLSQPETILYEWLKHSGFSEKQLKDIMQLCHAQTGKYVASATHRLIRNRAWLVLVPMHQATATLHVIEEVPATVVLNAEKILTIEPYNAAQLHNLAGGATSPDIAVLNAGHMKLPLIVRKWKQGDYFYPLGMQGKKKIARFLIDQKVPAHQKENIWVVESEKKICWVVGYRIDERFKLKPTTTQCILLKVN